MPNTARVRQRREDRLDLVALAVEERRRGDARLAQPLQPARVLVDRRSPRDVVDGAGALPPRAGRGVVGDRPAATLASELPGRIARALCPEHALEQRA